MRVGYETPNRGRRVSVIFRDGTGPGRISIHGDDHTAEEISAIRSRRLRTKLSLDRDRIFKKVLKKREAQGKSNAQRMALARSKMTPLEAEERRDSHATAMATASAN